MSTIRLTVTPELKKELDFLRLVEYPALTDAEIVKVAFVEKAVSARRKATRVDDLDYSDPTLKELMWNAAKSFELEDDGVDEEPFWDESKLKPIKLKNYV